MNGNNFYEATIREIKKTAERINYKLTEDQVILIADSRNWKKYSRASATENKKIHEGLKLDNLLIDAQLTYDYPELA